MVSMFWPGIALVVGILLLVFSADKFVDGAAVTAKYFGLPPLLIGILVIGFGSSMPEMVISTISANQGNPGLALGNALGSNISNIALILGVTAIISPVVTGSTVLHRELPFLMLVTAIMALLFYYDGVLNRIDAVLLCVTFLFVMGWSVYAGITTQDDQFGEMVELELQESISIQKALTYLVLGLIFLVISSRIMVWGGVEIATKLGISDLIIGLTIVAIGTSLPELASSIAAVRKNEHDLALGNVIGSNMFNTSVVISITGFLSPTPLEPELLNRDLPVVIALTIILFMMCYGFRSEGAGRINRWEGVLLVLAYTGYIGALIFGAVSS
jgi:cation:H+ antiporter